MIYEYSVEENGNWRALANHFFLLSNIVPTFTLHRSLWKFHNFPVRKKMPNFLVYKILAGHRRFVDKSEHTVSYVAELDWRLAKEHFRATLQTLN